MKPAALPRPKECESVRGEWGGICPDCGQRLPVKPGALSARVPSDHAHRPRKRAFGGAMGR